MVNLSRLGGLPGGVFIQLKQAGAATQFITVRCSAGFVGADDRFVRSNRCTNRSNTY